MPARRLVAHLASDEFTRALMDEGIRISMDGKGRFVDNLFIERF